MVKELQVIFWSGIVIVLQYRYLFKSLLVAALLQNLVIFRNITNGVQTTFLSICIIILYFKEREIRCYKSQVIGGGRTVFSFPVNGWLNLEDF